MAKVEFTTPEQRIKQSIKSLLPKDLPKEWQAYQWAIDELGRHFEKVVWKLFSFGCELAVAVGDKGAKQYGNRRAFFLKHQYHGVNAKYYINTEDGEECPPIYTDPDWQEYDLMKQENPQLFLSKIIETIKSEFNLKQQGAL